MERRGQGKTNYLAMVVSTGIGGGLVLDGRLVEGRTGNAGHVGHVLVRPGRKAMFVRRPAVVSKPRPRGGPSPPLRAGSRRRPARTSSSTPGDWWGKRWPRWPTCATWTWSSWPARSPLGMGRLFLKLPTMLWPTTPGSHMPTTALVVPAGLGAKAPLIGCAAVAWRGLGEQLLVQR